MKITAHKNVYNRQEAKNFEITDLLQNPSVILESFNLLNYREKLEEIKATEDKATRNEIKRDYLPAVDLSTSGVLSIDIDGLSDKSYLKKETIVKLRNLPACFAAMESVSGNVVAFFKWDCPVSDYPFLYYKLYLELTLLLSVNIDFLPELGRLRYVSLGELYHFNPDARPLTEVLRTNSLPYINTNTAKEKARKLIYGSR